MPTQLVMPIWVYQSPLNSTISNAQAMLRFGAREAA